MAAFNADDPRHQREQQKAAAKRSMGPTRGVARSTRMVLNLSVQDLGPYCPRYRFRIT